MTTQLLLIAALGAVGTLSRHFLAGFAQSWMGPAFPYGTVLVNLIGCALIGFLGTLADGKMLLSPQARGILMAGFLGAFTTYSSFAYDTWLLFKVGSFLPAFANVLITFIGCFVGLFVGIQIARLF